MAQLRFITLFCMKEQLLNSNFSIINILRKFGRHGQTDTLRYLLSRFPEVVNASDHVRFS